MWLQQALDQPDKFGGSSIATHDSQRFLLESEPLGGYRFVMMACAFAIPSLHDLLNELAVKGGREPW